MINKRRIKRGPIITLLFFLVASATYQISERVLPTLLIEVNEYNPENYKDLVVTEIDALTWQTKGAYDKYDVEEAQTTVKWGCDHYRYHMDVNFEVHNNSTEDISFRAAAYVNTVQYGGVSAARRTYIVPPGHSEHIRQNVVIHADNYCIFRPDIDLADTQGRVGVTLSDISMETALRIDTIVKKRYRTHTRSCYSFLPSCKDQQPTSLDDDIDDTLILKDLGVIPAKGHINTSMLNVRNNPIPTHEDLMADEPIGQIDDQLTFTVLDVDDTLSYINNKAGYWMLVDYNKGGRHTTGYLFSKNVVLDLKRPLSDTL